MKWTTKRANLDEAIKLAHEDLLMGLVGRLEVSSIASELNDGPIPYSTHDLAMSVALNFFRKPERFELEYPPIKSGLT